MAARAVKLKVFASVPKVCSFWLENDGWSGACEELSLTVHGSSFEDAKRKMETALQAHIESVLRKDPGKEWKEGCLTDRAAGMVPHELTDTTELTPPILDEMSFRFNRPGNADLFLDTLRHMVTAPVLTFEKLTA